MIAPTLPADWRFNGRYNRIETPAEHRYITDFGFRGVGNHQHSGFIKCKLGHGTGYSVVIPDLLFIADEGTAWLQPLAFGPNILTRVTSDDIRCELSVDVSCGHRVMVSFSTKAFIRSLPDGSELYRCTLRGPENLQDFATGHSQIGEDSIPRLTLFHHTRADAKNSISESGHFRLSRWNIQGTKKLTNVGYVYLTALHEIVRPEDLHNIAMASNGILHFIVDDFVPPQPMPPDWKSMFSDSILELPVYRESTTNRTATIELLVDSTCLAPQPLWRHSLPGEPVYYEICCPFIHRIGLPPDQLLHFSNGGIEGTTIKQKRFEYVVIGDCRSLNGLIAPFDEENTAEIVKLESIPSGSNLAEFWFRHGNTDLYSPKSPELQSFESS